MLFTRGRGCARIAELVSGGSATRVDGDLTAACIAKRANLLVTAKASSFGLTSSLVLHGLDDTPRPPAVIGAVGTGPHSPLVAQATARIAGGLETAALLVTMARAGDDVDPEQVLEEMAAHAPDAERKLIHAETAADLVASLPSSALLVLGAPGGSWWQRQFFGPGRRLIHAAPAGAIVVRAAARRCFQSLIDLTAVSPMMGAADAAAVMSHDVAAVVSDSVVIGLVRRNVLLHAAPGSTVADVSESPVVAAADDLVRDIVDLSSHFDGAPVPVVDEKGRLLGAVAL